MATTWIDVEDELPPRNVNNPRISLAPISQSLLLDCEGTYEVGHLESNNQWYTADEGRSLYPTKWRKIE